MENASKALLMAAGVLVGVLVFAIFVYEFTVISGISSEVNDNMHRKDILEFNAKFEGFANRRNGYLGIENAISVQDVATLCNLTRDWNKNNEDDQITVTIVNRATTPNYNIFMSYLSKDGANSNEPLENLLTTLALQGDLEKCYFICASVIQDADSQGIKYENEGGRISEIRLRGRKID